MAFMMRTWGPLADKFGNKPVIVVASTVLMLVPVIWLFALPQAYRLPLAVAHALSGAAIAGAMLSHFNISMKLSPRAGRSVYLAAYSAVTGLIGGTAPIIGGYLSDLLQGMQVAMGGYEITGLHTIFLLSAALQVLILPGFLKLQETGAASPVAVIIQLQNDLNPQSGISSALDVAMVELERAEDILDDLDEVTETWAERSERKVANLLDSLSEPLKKIRDALRHDE
jgi:MFS family permease